MQPYATDSFILQLSDYAKIEKEAAKQLQKSNCFEDLPHPGTGYYHIIKHIFVALGAYYQTNVSCDSYFYALRVSFCIKEEPQSVSDIWKIVSSPSKKMIQVANDILIETQSVLKELRHKREPDLNMLFILIVEIEEQFKRAMSSANWCPNLKLDRIISADNYTEVEDYIFKLIREASKDPQKILELAACRFTLKRNCLLSQENYEI